MPANYREAELTLLPFSSEVTAQRWRGKEDAEQPSRFLIF
jgi:hypothetical protein